MSASGVPSLLGRAPDAWTATLLDAGPANVEEMDDMHRQAILHPGPVVVPALAGLARSGVPRRRVLDALVRGYEAMIRVGRSVGPRHYALWHNTATAGVASAVVSLEAGEARVSYDPARVSANALRAVIEDAGFDAA